MLTPDVSRPTGLRAQRRADLIEHIHAIALRRFDEDGYEALALKDVCHEAGISLRTLFRHFGGKDAILGLGIEQRQHEIEQRLALRPAEEPILTAFRHAIDGMVSHMNADPQSARLTQRLIQEIPAIRAQYIIPSADHRTDVVDEQLAIRLGRPPHDDKGRLLRCFMHTAVVQAITNWLESPRHRDLGEIVDDYLALLAPVVDRLRLG